MGRVNRRITVEAVLGINVRLYSKNNWAVGVWLEW
jgi:hypothetical protein